MKKTYDVLVIGPVSLDHNIDYQGNERKEVGGAVVAGPVLVFGISASVIYGLILVLLGQG